MNIMCKLFPNTLPLHLLGALLLTAAVLRGEIVLTFDSDIEGFQVLDWHDTDAAWSDEYGGTLMITTTGNWQWAARLQSSEGPFFEEMQLAMTNGGTLTFDLIVDPDGLPAGSFDLHVAAEHDGGDWNQLSPITVTHEEVAGGPVTFPVSIPIRPADNSVSGALTYASGAGRFDLIIGRSEGTAEGATVFHIDNFAITAGDEPLEEPPPPPLGGVVLTFDEDTEGFFSADWMPGSVVWSDKHGGEDSGSLAITTGGTWQWAAQLFVTEGPLFTELSQSMVNGGTLVFDVIVDDAGLPEGSIAIHVSGSSDASDWNQTSPLTVTQDDLAAGEGVASFTVSIPLLPTPSAGILAFSPDSTNFEINLGRADGSAEGETTFHVDNFRVVAGEEPLEEPEPLGPFDPVTVSFDFGTDGFQKAFGDEVEGTVVEHSSGFGGSVRIVKGDNGLLEYEKIAEFDIADWANTLLISPMQQAGVLGGFIEMDIVFPADAIELNMDPGFELWIQFKNPDVEVGEFGPWGEQRVIIDAFGPGETPTTEERRFTISVPLVPEIDTTSYADPELPIVSAYKPAAGNSRYFFEIGAAHGALGEATFHVERISVIPARPAAAVTFDDDAEGFGVPEANGASPASLMVAHDPIYGGTLRINLPATAGTDTVDAAAAVMPHAFRQAVTRAIRNDGWISFDLIADTGVLEGVQPRVSLTSSEGGVVDAMAAAISGTNPLPLGDGRELYRVSLPLSAFGASADAAYTGIGLGFTYDSGSPFVVYVDNLTAELVLVDGPATTVLTFTDNLEGFEPTGAVNILHEPRTDDTGNLAMLVIGPTDWVWQTEAIFQTNSGTERAQAFASGLAGAAAGGGVLSFEVIFDDLSVRQPTQDFDGVSIIMAIESGGEWRQREFVFDDLDLPLASGQTAVRSVTVPLHPSGSSETDGFVVEPDSEYKVVIGSNTVEGSADSIEFFIDDLSVTSEPAPMQPIILAEPKLDLSGGAVAGRLLAAFADGATYSATGLPPGISIDPETGLITGTPTADGVFNVTFAVTTDGGTAEAEYVWAVSGTGTELDLVIVSFSHAEGTFTINWTGNGGEPVDVQRSENLNDLEGWSTIASGLTGTSFTDENAPEDKAFYQVVIP